MWEAWGRLPFPQDRYLISPGLGVYYFRDTQSMPGGDTADPLLLGLGYCWPR